MHDRNRKAFLSQSFQGLYSIIAKQEILQWQLSWGHAGKVLLVRCLMQHDNCLALYSEFQSKE